ncbi:MAG: hypothetical protein ACOYLQ_03940 [Hyphomicrobiaceae bacterium]
MTKLLDAAIDRVRQIPPEAHEELAAAMLHFAEMDVRGVPLTPEEKIAIAEAEAQLARGERVSDSELAAFWTAHAL